MYSKKKKKKKNKTKRNFGQHCINALYLTAYCQDFF